MTRPIWEVGQMTQTVVIAVNDPNILYLLQRYAEEAGLSTVSATRGRDLLALLGRQPAPSLVILDGELPGPGSPKMTHRLKAEAALRRIPVLVYSCLDEPMGDCEEGVAGYLPKSVMYDDFVAALKHAGVS
jgi:CheY-like chemotaxis protein